MSRKMTGAVLAQAIEADLRRFIARAVTILGAVTVVRILREMADALDPDQPKARG